jgi:pyruvate dehydrogenase E2 component (dihydrolipoamide acetyltransferase)
MPAEIYLVKVGMNMSEGVVEEWYVPDGGSVSTGELLYRLETEKVNLDIDAEHSGTVRHLVGEGITMKPGDVVGYIFLPGEEIPAELPEAGSQPAAASAQTDNTQQLTAASPSAPASGGRLRSSPIARRLARRDNIDITMINGSGPDGRIVEADVLAARQTDFSDNTDAPSSPSSPMARRVARELNIDLSSVSGTGPGGRITAQDVEEAAETTPATTATGGLAQIDSSQDRIVPVKGMRRTIATRMHSSLQETAQLTMDMDVMMDDAVKLRGQLITEWESLGIRPTYTDLVICATAKALRTHPLMNSTMTETEIRLLGDIHVGMAVALDEGLIVPVVHHTDRLGMQALVVETTRLAEAARAGSLGIDELHGGTFTVSALGMFGVDSFTPIINSPQSGILGINRIRDSVAWEGSEPVKRLVMRLSLTWDHRALDGAPAAKFLAEVRDLLQAPYRLLV